MSKQSLKALHDQERGREIALQHDIMRGMTLAQRRAERLRLTLGQRVDEGLRCAQTLSEAPSGPYEPRSARPKGESRLPDLRAVEGVYERYAKRLALMIRNMEDEIDYIKLRPVGHKERREDRLKRLLGSDYEGLSAEEVAFIDPSQGTVLSIRRERHAAGRDQFGKKREVGSKEMY